MQKKRTSALKTVHSILVAEQGAALVVAMLAVLVMTIMGLVLMDVLKNSYAQVSASEGSIQAEALAQKGLDETLALIREAVVRANANKDYRDKIEAIQKELGDLKDRIAKRPNGEALRGSYSITVEWSKKTTNEFPAIIPETDKPYKPYVMQAKVVATGTVPVGGRNRTINKNMLVYISTINPVFRYPVSASENLALNGMSYVVGDIYAKESLISAKKAKFFGPMGVAHELETKLPAVKGFVKAGNYADANAAPGLSGRWDQKYFYDNVFPFEDLSLTGGTGINIKDYVDNKMSVIDNKEWTGYVPLPRNDDDLVGPSIGTANGAINVTGNTIVEGQWVTITGNTALQSEDGKNTNLAVIDGVLSMRNAPVVDMHNGSIYVSYNDSNLVAADLYGTFNVAEGQQIVVDGNVTLNDGFTMTGQGRMYVRGQLKIIGNVNVQGTIYVDGDVELKQTSSINNNNDSKSLIIAATGSFIFADNRMDNGAQIRAFLYSEEKNIDLYGVVSKVNIRGGVHGVNVTLSAIGESGALSDTVFNGSGDNTAYKFSSQQNVKPTDSKLQIFYDDALYTDPPPGIPTVDKINVYVKQITY